MDSLQYRDEMDLMRLLMKIKAALLCKMNLFLRRNPHVLNQKFSLNTITPLNPYSIANI